MPEGASEASDLKVIDDFFKETLSGKSGIYAFHRFERDGIPCYGFYLTEGPLKDITSSQIYAAEAGARKLRPVMRFVIQLESDEVHSVAKLMLRKKGPLQPLYESRPAQEETSISARVHRALKEQHKVAPEEKKL